MKKLILTLLSTLLLQSYVMSEVPVKGPYIENSKHSEGPISFLIFRSTNDANKWMNDILTIAALDKSYADTKKVTDAIWSYVAKPLAAIGGLSAAMGALQSGANAFTDWLHNLDKQNRVGNPEEKWRKGLPAIITVYPGNVKVFTPQEIDEMRKYGKFETKPDTPFGNKELFSILAVDKDNNVKTAFYVPVDSQILSLALQDLQGQFTFGFKEKKVGGWASQLWSTLQQKVFDKYGTQAKLEEMEQANIQANRVTIKQVKDFLQIK